MNQVEHRKLTERQLRFRRRLFVVLLVALVVLLAIPKGGMWYA